MTYRFGGKGIRIPSTLQRGMFWNQPEQKSQLEETTKNAEMVGHRPQTAHKFYRNALIGKESGVSEEGIVDQNTDIDITEPPAKHIRIEPGYGPITPCYTTPKVEIIPDWTSCSHAAPVVEGYESE